VSLNVLYLAGAIACLLIGGGVAYGAWMLGKLLQDVRLTVLPTVQQTLLETEHTLQDVRLNTLPQVTAGLHEVQVNLKHTEEVVRGVAASVNGTNEAMGKALQTIDSGMQSVQSGMYSAGQAVGTGVSALNENVAVPVSIQARSLFEGLKAGYRALRGEPKVTSVIMTPDTVREQAASHQDIIQAG
jgi:hypothetical protein